MARADRCDQAERPPASPRHRPRTLSRLRAATVLRRGRERANATAADRADAGGPERGRERCRGCMPRQLRSSRVLATVLRRPCGLAPRPDFWTACAARSLEPPRSSRERQRRRLQSGLGAEPAPVDGQPWTGLPAERRRAVRPRLRHVRQAVDGRQPSRDGDQLGEQPRGRAAADLLVLEPPPLRRIASAVRGTVRRSDRGDLDPRHARGALSLALLLTEHASHGRGPRPLLRRAAPPRPAALGPLAHARRANSGGPERAPDPSRRRLLRAVDRLRAVHARDLSPLPHPGH